MIRVLAFTLTQVFFHRQVRSNFRKCSIGFCNLARRPADQILVVARTNSSLGPFSPNRNLLPPRVGAWATFLLPTFQGLWTCFATSFSRANPAALPETSQLTVKSPD
jgi:hypothetical protein